MNVMTDHAATLRSEFEPLLISPLGLHVNAEKAKDGWNLSEALGNKDIQLREEIARAEEWLQLCHRVEDINYNAGTSYYLKLVVERWHQERGTRGYVQNGCFLMAARRLGFQMKGEPGSYWGHSLLARDC